LHTMIGQQIVLSMRSMKLEVNAWKMSEDAAARAEAAILRL